MKKWQADFKIRQDTFQRTPVINLSITERQLLEEEMWKEMRLLPDEIAGLLGPAANFCQLDQLIQSLEKPTIEGSSISYGLYPILMDYHHYNLDLPGKKSFEKKMEVAVYRDYVLKSLSNYFGGIVKAWGIARSLSDIQIDQKMVDVQLEHHPYFTSRLMVDLPIKKDWFKLQAQRTWVEIKANLDRKQPSLITIIDPYGSITEQRTAIALDYQILDKWQLAITTCNLTRDLEKWSFSFKDGFELKGIKSPPTDSNKITLLHHQLAPTEPPATNWLERQLFPVITNRHLMKVHRKIKSLILF